MTLVKSYLTFACLVYTTFAKETVDFESCIQSSTSGDFEGAECELAMDKRHSECNINEFSHTQNLQFSWWQGTLIKKTNIKQVGIVGRKNAPYSEGLRDFYIILDYEKQCAGFKFSRAVQSHVFKCEGASRTVKIQLMSSGHLSLCEVTVYGSPVKPTKTTIDYKDLRFNRCYQSTTQSSNAACEKAMDEKYAITECGVSQYSMTKVESNPYWVGLFKNEVEVAQVRLIGRENPSDDHPLRNFKITLNGGETCASYLRSSAVRNEAFNCTGSTRDIFISMRGRNYLSLCEVIPYRLMGYHELLDEYNKQPPKCKPEYNLHVASNMCYFFLDDKKYHYDEAYEKCRAKGGRIMEPRMWVTINYIKSHASLKRYECYFMGVASESKKFYFESDLSKQMTINNNWAKNEPNDIKTGRKTVVYMDGLGTRNFGKFSDVDRDDWSCYTICESEPI